jgi:hypothetical protein
VRDDPVLTGRKITPDEQEALAGACVTTDG